MSRIGKLPIVIPAKVEVSIHDNEVHVSGPKGKLQYTLPGGVAVAQVDNNLIVTLVDNEFKQMRGLVRTLVSNMVEGVTNGYQKKLHVLGVGYNAKVQGKKIILNLGYSHPVDHILPDAITAEIERDPKGADIITLSSIDKQLVGEHAAKIRGYRAPEPYKGKGVRYFGEFIKLKAGKTAGK